MAMTEKEMEEAIKRFPRDIQLLSKKSPSDLRDDTKKKAERYKDVWLELTKNIFTIQMLNIFKDWGYSNIYEYAEKELAIEEREVRYWISIYKKFSIDLSIPDEKIARKPWSKLRTVVPVVNRKNVDEWLEKVDKLTQPKLQRAVTNKLRGKEEDATGPEMETLSFTVTEEEKKTIKSALSEAARLVTSGRDRDGHLLEMICLHFLGDHPDNRKEAFAEMIAKLEQVFHVKLLAVDKDNPQWKELFEKARDLIRGAQIEV